MGGLGWAFCNIYMLGERRKRSAVAAEASDWAGDGDSAGAGGGSQRWACTHHPTRGQPPPPPATAPTAAPITTACDNFFATLTAACSALEARAPTVPPAQALWWSITLWGRRVVARGPRGQGSGQVERGHTSVDFRAIQAARAAAAPCSSSGNTRRWHR